MLRLATFSFSLAQTDVSAKPFIVGNGLNR